MVPWKREQVAFWLAAILVVVGFAAQDAEKRRLDRFNEADNSPQVETGTVFRTRESLPAVQPIPQDSPGFLPAPNLKENLAAQQLIAAADRSAEQASVLDQQVQPADYSSGTNKTASDSEPSVIQMSLQLLRQKDVSKPAVWLTGEIEPISE